MVNLKRHGLQIQLGHFRLFLIVDSNLTWFALLANCFSGKRLEITTTAFYTFSSSSTWLRCSRRTIFTLIVILGTHCTWLTVIAAAYSSPQCRLGVRRAIKTFSHTHLRLKLHHITFFTNYRSRLETKMPRRTVITLSLLLFVLMFAVKNSKTEDSRLLIPIQHSF